MDLGPDLGRVTKLCVSYVKCNERIYSSDLAELARLSEPIEFETVLLEVHTKHMEKRRIQEA